MTRSAFVGPCIDVHAYNGPFVAQAAFNGCIMVANLPRADVSAILPSDLELADAVASDGAVHPMVFIFGEQTESTTRFAGLPYPLGIRYYELGIAVPFVKHRRGHYLHVYIPRMCSDFFPATWSGNAFYGYAKEMTKMRWEGTTFVMTGADEALLLHAVVQAEGSWGTGGDCALPNFAAMRELFALPVVGRKADGTYVGSYFDWDFTDAEVRGADCAVSIDGPILPGLPQRTCHDVVNGTFEVRRMVWRVSWPSACHF